MKKLTLRKETLAALSDPELGGVVAGTGTAVVHTVPCASWAVCTRYCVVSDQLDQCPTKGCDPITPNCPTHTVGC